jgi:hypothetical protein
LPAVNPEQSDVRIPLVCSGALALWLLLSTPAEARAAPRPGAKPSPPAAAKALPLRQSFSQKLARIVLTGESSGGDETHYNEAATTEAAVIALLGPPDQVRPGGYEGEKELCYGTDGSNTLPTLGWVRIDERGRARFVAGGHGPPLLDSDWTEIRLRRALHLIDRFPEVDYSWDPGAAVRAVNTLLPLGKERVLDAVGEYIRISLMAVNEDTSWPAPEKTIALLRLLFPGVRGDHTAPLDVRVLHDVPLLIPRVGGRTGSYGILPDHLDPYRRHGRLRQKPLLPGPRPWTLLEHPEVRRLLEREEELSRTSIPYGLRLQVLRLVAPALDLQRSSLQTGKSEDELNGRWRAAVARGETLRLVWNPRKQAYVPSVP